MMINPTITIVMRRTTLVLIDLSSNPLSKITPEQNLEKKECMEALLPMS